MSVLKKSSVSAVLVVVGLMEGISGSTASASPGDIFRCQSDTSLTCLPAVELECPLLFSLREDPVSRQKYCQSTRVAYRSYNNFGEHTFCMGLLVQAGGITGTVLSWNIVRNPDRTSPILHLLEYNTDAGSATGPGIIPNTVVVDSESGTCRIAVGNYPQLVLPEPPKADDCGVGTVRGNPVELSTRKKVESISCINHSAPGIDIDFGLRYVAPRTFTLAPGQSAAPQWRHSYSRKMLSYQPQAGGPTYRRLQMENGEVYDFLQTTVVGSGDKIAYASLSGPAMGYITPRTISENFVYRYPSGEEDTFDAAGNLIRHTRRNGAYLTFSRTGNTQLDITSWPSGRIVRVEFADQGGGNFQPVRVTDINPPGGTPVRSATMGYQNGMLTKFVDVAGRTRQYRYDSLKRMIKTYDPLNDPDVLGVAAKGTDIFYACSTCNEVAYEINGSGSRIDFLPVTGQPFNLEVRQTTPANQTRSVRYLFDSRLKLAREYVTNSTTKYYGWLRDAAGNVSVEIDPERRMSTYQYSAGGFLTNRRVYNSDNTYDEWRFLVNEFGQTTEVREPSGSISRITYDEVKGVPTQLSAEGVVNGVTTTQTTTIAYAPVSINGQSVQVGLPTSMTLPDGTVLTQSYDSRGYPSVTTMDAGSGRLNLTETSVFDGRGFLTSSVDVRGVRTNYEYANNPALGQFGNLGIPSAMVFDTQGVNGFSARNIRTEYTYDAKLNPTRIVEDAGAGRKNATTLLSWAMVGTEGEYALTQGSNALNRQFRLEYDGFGQLAKMIEVGARTTASNNLVTCSGSTEARANATDRVTRVCYTPEGWVQKSILDDGRISATLDYAGFGDGLARAFTDARGVRTQLTYDQKGRLSGVRLGTAGFTENGQTLPAINGELSYTYDGNDRLTQLRQKVDASNWRTLVSYQYDGLGRLQSETDAAGSRTDYSYTNRNFLSQIVSGAQHTGSTAGEKILTQFNYDRLGRIVNRRLDPNGKNLTHSYVYAGTDRWLPNSMVDANGNATQYRYNAFGRIEQITDALNSSWFYSTDNLGFLTKVDVPGAGADTLYNVNLLGEVLSVSRNGKSESWTYRPDGSVASYLDFANQTVNYSYDATGRVIAIDYSGRSDDPNGARSDVSSIQYWANDLLRSVTSKPNGVNDETTTYSYDAANRLSKRNRGGRDVNYGYALDDSLTSLGYWSRGSVTYGYGAASSNNGLIRSLSMFGQSSSNYTYRANNALSAIARPNGVASNFGLDTAGRLIDINHTKAGALTQRNRYDLDSNGNVLQLTEEYAGQSELGTNVFRYDALNRLIRAEQRGLGQLESIQNFSYDEVGNRKQVQNAKRYNSSDLDRDIPTANKNVPDLFWRDTAGGSNLVWLLGGGDGSRRIGGPNMLTIPDTSWKMEATGDATGDGISELYWHNNGPAGTVLYWKLGGSSGADHVGDNTLSTAVPGSDWNLEAVADFNRDKFGDLLWRNYVTGQNVIWLMGGTEGQTRVGEVTLMTIADSTWKIEGAADMNRDGFVDIIWRHTAGAGEIAYWFMGGNGTSLQSSIYLPNTVSDGNWRIESVGDHNQDGVPDLVWRQAATAASVQIWFMTGANGDVVLSSKNIVEDVNSTAITPGPNWKIAHASSYHRVTDKTDTSFDASDRIVGASYDAAENLAAQAGSTYAYTATNKLLRSTFASITTEYQYDGAGNLIRSIRGGVTTDYVLDESSALPRVIGEISSDGKETAYVYGPEGLHAQHRWNSGTYQGAEYTLTDALGSIKASTSSTGAINRALSYDAWGNTRYSAGTAPLNLAFTGEQQFPDGTVHLRARSYVQAIGRFLQRDPFAGFADRPQSLNRFAYVEGNPTGMVDPSGFAGTTHGVGNLFGGGANAAGAVGAGAVATGAVGTGAAVVGAGAAGYQIGSGILETWAGYCRNEDLALYAGAAGDGAGILSGLATGKANSTALPPSTPIAKQPIWRDPGNVNRRPQPPIRELPSAPPSERSRLPKIPFSPAVLDAAEQVNGLAGSDIPSNFGWDNPGAIPEDTKDCNRPAICKLFDQLYGDGTAQKYAKPRDYLDGLKWAVGLPLN